MNAPDPGPRPRHDDEGLAAAAALQLLRASSLPIGPHLQAVTALVREHTPGTEQAGGRGVADAVRACRPALRAYVASVTGTDPRTATALAARARRRGTMRSQLAVLATTSDPVAHRRAVLALRALTP